MRELRLMVEGVIAAAIVGLASVLLFWLGRTPAEVRGELVVDDLSEDDPGVNLEGDLNDVD